MGASALLIVFVLLTGFFFNRFSKARYYRLLQFSGQHLYNKLLVNGACFFLAALFVAFAVKALWPNLISAIPPTVVASIRSINLLGSGSSNVVFISLIAGMLAAAILSIVQNIFHIRKIKKDHPDIQTPEHVENFLLHSHIAMTDPVKSQLVVAFLSEGKEQMIFMSDRKVYMGVVDRLQLSTDFREDITHFLFRPSKSGYREKDTLEVNITTDYKDYKEKKLTVLLKVSDVISIREYDEAQFEHFIEQKASERNSLKLRKY